VVELATKASNTFRAVTQTLFFSITNVKAGIYAKRWDGMVFLGRRFIRANALSQQWLRVVGRAKTCNYVLTFCIARLSISGCAKRTVFTRDGMGAVFWASGRCV